MLSRETFPCSAVGPVLAALLLTYGGAKPTVPAVNPAIATGVIVGVLIFLCMVLPSTHKLDGLLGFTGNRYIVKEPGQEASGADLDSESLDILYICLYPRCRHGSDARLCAWLIGV